MRKWAYITQISSVDSVYISTHATDCCSPDGDTDSHSHPHVLQSQKAVTTSKISKQLMPISFPRHYRRLRFVFLKLRLDCDDDNLSSMDNDNTVIFLLGLSPM